MELCHRVLIPTYLIGFSEKLQNPNAPCQTAISQPPAEGSPRVSGRWPIGGGFGRNGDLAGRMPGKPSHRQESASARLNIRRLVDERKWVCPQRPVFDLHAHFPGNQPSDTGPILPTDPRCGEAFGALP